MSLGIFDLDGKLRDVQGQIWDRVNGYKWWKGELTKNEGSVEKFAEGYKIFGFNKVEGGYTYREWLPNAKNVWLIGDFNGWQNTWPLTSEGYGRWVLNVKDNADGSPGIPHRSGSRRVALAPTVTLTLAPTLDASRWGLPGSLHEACCSKLWRRDCART